MSTSIQQIWICPNLFFIELQKKEKKQILTGDKDRAGPDVALHFDLSFCSSQKHKFFSHVLEGKDNM